MCAATTGELLSLIRDARGDNIATSGRLNVVAQSRAEEITTDYSHAGADHPYAEIIAYNAYPEAYTEAVAVHQWLESPGHRAILLGDYNTVGVGVANVDARHYYAAVFANRRTPTTGTTGSAPVRLPDTDTVPC